MAILAPWGSVYAMPRVYVPYPEKHKMPKGYGPLCPKMPNGVPVGLLERAIAIPSVAVDKLWVTSGRWCFCAKPSPHVGPDAWHGLPVIGGEVDERVLAALETEGIITARERRRLRAQRTLPEIWP